MVIELNIPLPGNPEGGLFVEVLEDGQHYRLTRPYAVRVGDVLIVAPEGMVTDFASVPRAFWRLVPPTGRYNRAAVIHDWLYRSGLVTRAQADRIFRELMRAMGVAAWRRNAMYWAVRACGASAWEQYRREEQNRAEQSQEEESRAEQGRIETQSKTLRIGSER